MVYLLLKEDTSLTEMSVLMNLMTDVLQLNLSSTTLSKHKNTMH